jgi:hypothetical protein
VVRIRRQRERGAIFVEAIIVIATMTLVLLSMVFFENMYMKKLRVARLARATVIAYSMRGCPDGQDAAQWASVDLDPKAILWRSPIRRRTRIRVRGI